MIPKVGRKVKLKRELPLFKRINNRVEGTQGIPHSGFHDGKIARIVHGGYIIAIKDHEFFATTDEIVWN